MKKLTLMKQVLLYVGILIGNVTPIWAATTGREADHSDLFVWIFLAFCALIVIAQLIPAALVLMGFAKGAKKENLEEAPIPAEERGPSEKG